jgi:hypothetical protein
MFILLYVCSVQSQFTQMSQQMVGSGWAATMVLCSDKGILSHAETKVATVGRPRGSGSTDSRPDVDSSESAGFTGSRGRGGESNKGSNLTLKYKHYEPPPVNPRAAAVLEPHELRL